MFFLIRLLIICGNFFNSGYGLCSFAIGGCAKDLVILFRNCFVILKFVEYELCFAKFSLSHFVCILILNKDLDNYFLT